MDDEHKLISRYAARYVSHISVETRQRKVAASVSYRDLSAE